MLQDEHDRRRLRRRRHGDETPPGSLLKKRLHTNSTHRRMSVVVLLALGALLALTRCQEIFVAVPSDFEELNIDDLEANSALFYSRMRPMFEPPGEELVVSLPVFNSSPSSEARRSVVQQLLDHTASQVDYFHFDGRRAVIANDSIPITFRGVDYYFSGDVDEDENLSRLPLKCEFSFYESRIPIDWMLMPNGRNPVTKVVFGCVNFSCCGVECCPNWLMVYVFLILAIVLAVALLMMAGYVCKSLRAQDKSFDDF